MADQLRNSAENISLSIDIAWSTDISKKKSAVSQLGFQKWHN